MSRAYQNFDLLIEQDGSTYRARVTQCPLAVSPAVTFLMPFSEMELELVLLKLDPGRSGMRRSAASTHAQVMMDFGGALFEAVFREDVALAWAQSQEMVRRDGQGLRLRLRLADAPSAARLPWELLYDRRSNLFPAQSDRSPVVRFLEVPYVPRPLSVDGALRVLAVLSSPTDLDDLDVDREWRLLNDSLGPQMDVDAIRLDRLPAATLPALADWLARHEVHVLHFVGHGQFDERLQDGVLLLCDRYGRSDPVSASVLGPHLRDHDPLRLIVLNACQSALADVHDPFAGVAQGLVQQDAAAVVAMQFPISDGAAARFSDAFYGSLGDGTPVDQAVTTGRKALIGEFPTEWATPVLFMRSPDGRIFEHATPRSAHERSAAQVLSLHSEVTGLVVESIQRVPRESDQTAFGRPSRPDRAGWPGRRTTITVLAAVFAVAVALIATVWTLGQRQADPSSQPTVPPTTMAIPGNTPTLPLTSSAPSASTLPQGTPSPDKATGVAPADAKTLTILDSNLGGTWSRSDPNQGGTLPAEPSKPSNGVTWYPNNRTLRANCYSRAASYPVHYKDGHTENWTSWLRLTDNTWVPSAVMSEIHNENPTGLNAC